MAADFTLTTHFEVPPARVYDAWVTDHAAMTGAGATSDPRVGGRFTAWDGYIEGTWLALEPGRRITMAWRTSQFPNSSPDARVDLSLEADGAGTRLVLTQSGTPSDQAASYEKGWEEHYFSPMRRHFGAAR